MLFVVVEVGKSVLSLPSLLTREISYASKCTPWVNAVGNIAASQ